MNIESCLEDGEYTTGWLAGVNEQRYRIKKALGDK